MTDRTYSDLTITLTKELSKIEKKEYGFFATPPSIIDQLLNRVKHFQEIIQGPVQRILEPSCGTCEFVSAISPLFPTATIDAVEYNTNIYQKISNETFGFPGQVYLHHHDFLKWEPSYKYDLIIGNPPYFVCPKEQVPSRYHGFMIGRPNMFGVFLVHSLEQLNPGGILAFVIPKSFMNSGFYGRIREHILLSCCILDIIDYESVDDFIDTKQATFGLIIQKANPQEKNPFVLQFNGQYIFTESSEKLSNCLTGSTTLKELGYSVKTGTIVWNQHKKRLTDDNTKTFLIYNTNISENNVIQEKTFKNGEKKQFIELDGVKEQCIVVNRGNGNTAYKLTYTFVDGSRPYLIENHLNRIIYTGKGKADYKQIIKSFQDKRTTEFLHSFNGNGGLSKTELETIFPIYL
jgi:adenine-specific DNA-methyltransferase